MPLKNRKGSGGFYKKEEAEKRIYTIIGYNKKTNKTWEQEKTTSFKIAREYVDNNTKDDVEYYVYLENNSNRIIYPIG